MRPDLLTPRQPVLSDADKIDWLRLIRTENVGPITFHKLLAQFGSASAALDALPALSRKGGRLKPQTPPTIAAAEAEMEEAAKFGATMIFAAEENYPIGLAAIDDAPPVLTVRGDLQLLRRGGIGMVGARNASLNGRKFAEKLARDLGQAGEVVISGLARGIDTAAHAGALDTGTIAAVAGGINIVYPAENKALYDQIADFGLIVAESPFGTEPIARHFPRRNRIISALATGVVVVEATLQSGSLITARMAAEQGRDVYAVPGHPLDPRAAGPNKLLKDGAILVESAQDILTAQADLFGHKRGLREAAAAWPVFTPPDAPEPAHCAAETGEDAAETILATLSPTPVTVDEIIQTCHMKTGTVAAALLELELAGRVQRLPGNRVILLT